MHINLTKKTHRLECFVTKQTFYVPTERYMALIKKYGSEDNLQKKYISRLGRKLLDDKFTDHEIKMIVEYNIDLKTIDKDVLEFLYDIKKEKE